MRTQHFFFHFFLPFGMKSRIRIKDIAERSGVSTGTVDRVIHERGNVAIEVKNKVLAVMQELNYQPNILARALANNKMIRIATLLPDFHHDPYWLAHQTGISTAIRDHQHYGIAAESFYYDYLDAGSFVSRTADVLAFQPDAVLLAPIFHHESVFFSRECYDRGIAVATINTDIGIETNLCYIGQDSYQSGQLAGRLLDQHFKAGDQLLLLHMEPEVENAVHLLNKERGFRDYYAHRNSPVHIQRRDLPYSHPHLDSALRGILSETGPIRGVFVSSSRAYLIAPLLKSARLDIRLVGFDLIDENVRYLLSEDIHFLINQNPEKQSYRGIASIVHHFVLNKKVQPVQYLPLDVIVPENVQYYLPEPGKPPTK